MICRQRVKALWAGQFIVIFLFLILAGCGRKAEQEVKNEAIPVRVMTIKEENIKDTLDYVGNIRAQEEAHVYPKVSGKVLEKNTHEGEVVIKGQTILFVDRDEVGFTFEKAPVESPIKGIVGRLLVDIGSNVTPATPVALVVDMDKAQINLSIPEIYVSKISLGQDAQVTTDAYPDKTFTGKISQISPVLDEETRSAPIEILIDNPDHCLKPGMFAKVSLVTEERGRALTVYKEAVMGTNGDRYVYVVRDGQARKQPVKLGMRVGQNMEVEDGLKAGEKVVIMGQQKLIDGSAVTTEE